MTTRQVPDAQIRAAHLFGSDPVSRPTTAQIRAVREQLAAMLTLDDQADEKMPPSQRCYVAGTLAALQWGDHDRPRLIDVLPVVIAWSWSCSVSPAAPRRPSARKRRCATLQRRPEHCR